MTDFEEEIKNRLNSDVNPDERAKRIAMVAIGSIADSLQLIVCSLSRIADILNEIEDDFRRKI